MMPPIHVVHVEDERPLRDILGIAFRAAEPGITLKQFNSGDDAWSYIEANSNNIDLFVLDIRLPGTMTGVEIAKKVRDLHCPGYIVLTSAYQAPDHDILKTLHSEYYPKPWHLFELTEKLLKYRMNKPPAAPKAQVQVDAQPAKPEASTAPTAPTVSDVSIASTASTTSTTPQPPATPASPVDASTPVQPDPQTPKP
jgi:DNA-binding response OmpR family regulator